MSKNNDLYLLMTLGMSLINWHSNGTLNREIRAYVLLYEKFGISTTIFDFSSYSAWTDHSGLSDFLERNGIRVICLYGNYSGRLRVIKYLSSITIFLMNVWINKSLFIKTNQTKGSHFVTISKIINRKIFFLHRSGYNYSVFTKNIFGLGIKYFLALFESVTSNFICDRIHVASLAEYQSLSSVSRSKTFVLPNWSEKIITDGNRLNHFIFVGRLVGQKNIVQLLENFPINRNLIVVGQGPLRPQLEEIVKRRRLSVIFHERLEHQALLKLIAQSQALICCSEYEGNPKVVIEAIVNEVPVILKSSPGLENLFHENTLGLKFDDFKELKEVINKIEYFKINRAAQLSFVRTHSLDNYITIEADLFHEFKKLNPSEV